MNLTPEELPARGFVKLESLDHAALIPFVQKALAKRTLTSVAYIVVNVVALLALGASMVLAHDRGQSVGESLNQVSLGIAATLMLIPIHEVIHVLAYRAVGARNTAIAAKWKQLIFFAVADRFVTSAREFVIVALAPFMVVTTGFLVAALCVPPAAEPFVLAALVSHTACCSGDFALLSWFESNRARAPITFDDRSRGLTEFWGRSLHDPNAGA